MLFKLMKKWEKIVFYVFNISLCISSFERSYEENLQKINHNSIK